MRAGRKGSFWKNFIGGYYHGDALFLERINYEMADEATCFRIQFVEADAYNRRDNPKEYTALAERIGDTDFNQMMPTNACPMSTDAFADYFSALHVTSDAVWDEAHPAGTPLDDILRIRLYSSAEFIRSGYASFFEPQDNCTFLGQRLYLMRCEKLVSELVPEDMEMIEYGNEWRNPIYMYPDEVFSPMIFFEAEPTHAQTHTLTVEWTTTEGVVKRGSITCNPKVAAEPEQQ